jgi:hypothetical protein
MFVGHLRVRGPSTHLDGQRRQAILAPGLARTTISRVGIAPIPFS